MHSRTERENIALFKHPASASFYCGWSIKALAWSSRVCTEVSKTQITEFEDDTDEQSRLTQVSGTMDRLANAMPGKPRRQSGLSSSAQLGETQHLSIYP
jgi:hypothetical protein